MDKRNHKWLSIPLIEVLDYEQPNQYIINTPIKEKGRIPVLTANKSFIKGYTDEKKDVYKDIPVIIFDDFTTDRKFVDFPFKVKSSAMKFLRPKNKDISLKYIYYQMSLVNVNATTHKRYYISTYQSIDFLLPVSADKRFDLQIQEDIVQDIETQFTHLDAAIKSLKTIKQKLEVYRKSVLKSVFDSVAEGEKATIDEIALFIGSGITPKGGRKIYLNEGVPFIRSQNIYPFKFISEGLAYVDKTLHTKMSRTHTQRDDVLLNITGASIGRCAVVPEEFEQANVNQHVCIIRRKENIDSKYLCAFLNSTLGQNQIMSAQGGVTRQGLNYQQLRRIKLPLPNKSAQKQIVLEIESRFSVIDKLEEVVNKSLLKAERLRKAILKVAFEGKSVN